MSLLFNKDEAILAYHDNILPLYNGCEYAKCINRYVVYSTDYSYKPGIHELGVLFYNYTRMSKI